MYISHTCIFYILKKKYYGLDIIEIIFIFAKYFTKREAFSLNGNKKLNRNGLHKGANGLHGL
jgi:hypothetical protein